MPRLIKDGRILEDTTTILGDADPLPEGPALIPLKRWLSERDRLRGLAQVGVWLNGDDEPQQLASDCQSLRLIAVRFPAFNDGRGLSCGVLLRTRFGFTGDLRAIGDVQRDQLNYMRRCGFSSFLIREDRDAEEALAGLSVMSDYYQGSVIDPQPLFRRR